MSLVGNLGDSYQASEWETVSNYDHTRFPERRPYAGGGGMLLDGVVWTIGRDYSGMSSGYGRNYLTPFSSAGNWGGFWDSFISGIGSTLSRVESMQARITGDEVSRAYASWQMGGSASIWLYNEDAYGYNADGVYTQTPLNRPVRVSIGNEQNGGATVYVENDGIGHVYLEVNGTVFSYGRYDGSYSPSSGAYGPVGKGVLLKKGSSFAKERMATNPTSVYHFPKADANAIYNYLNGIYESGTPAKNGGMVVDTYFLIGNNCTTITCGALRVGGVNIPTIQTPAGFNMFIYPVDMYYYEQWGPKY